MLRENIGAIARYRGKKRRAVFPDYYDLLLLTTSLSAYQLLVCKQL